MGFKEIEKKQQMENQVVGTVQANITAQDVDYILCGAIEGGINYWGYVVRDENKPAGVPVSEWATTQLLAGKSITIADVEMEAFEPTELTLEKLLNGIQMNMARRPHDCDLDNADADTYDAIVQYALFDSLVFG